MKVFAYIRVSGKKQVEGDGPERQTEAIQKFCKTHALELAGDPFFDKGVSGTKECLDRPAFADMLLAAKEQGIEGIVVEKADRLARDNMTGELLLRECRDRKIKVFCADREFIDLSTDDPENPSRTLIRQMFQIIAQWEKSVICLKLDAARRRVATQRNGKCEGIKAYGAHKDPAIAAQETAIRQCALQLQSQGRSTAQIAEYLNLSGQKTRRGTAWTKSSVHDIITRRHVKHINAI